MGDDCFRWESFGTSIAAGATTSPRNVGFDVDLLVSSLDVYLVLAADVRENALTGSVGGTITSALFGPLANALVTVSPGGQSGSSDAAGNYLVGGVAPGAATVGVSSTPTSCFRPAPRAVSVVAGTTADADFNLLCRPIAYTRFMGGGEYEVFVIRADGSGQAPVTNSVGDDFDPTWSPDGSRIAYSSGGEIAIVNADGSGKQPLTGDAFPDFEPAWSSDGSKIAFSSFRAGDSDLWMINANGTGQVRLTNTPVSERDATWSPDGSRIAFASGGDIWVMNATPGATPTKLTTNPFGDGYPSWSPDGTRIAYVATSQAGDGMGGADQFYEVYTMAADGSDQVRVTTDSFFDLQPAWSPDGSMLVYSSYHPGSPTLWVVSAAGGSPTLLTPSGQSGEGPAW